MKKDKKDTVILDADGVLLDWEKGFHQWILTRGYKLLNPHEFSIENRYNLDTKKAGDLVRYFNESVYAGDLDGYPKCGKYLKKIQDLGIKFVLITCFGGDDDLIRESRRKNIKKVYPKLNIDKIHFLNPTDSKEKLFKLYSDRAIAGIDDNMDHYLSLVNSSVFGCLLDHGYYNNIQLKNITKITTYKEFYEKVKERYEAINSNGVYFENSPTAPEFLHASR